jgi:hypothetical protein
LASIGLNAVYTTDNQQFNQQTNTNSKSKVQRAKLQQSQEPRANNQQGPRTKKAKAKAKAKEGATQHAATSAVRYQLQVTNQAPRCRAVALVARSLWLLWAVWALRIFE